jgi:predicted membrane protein
MRLSIWYDGSMNQTIVRIITGLFVIALGVGALLDALNILNFWEQFGRWWPLLLIGGGILLFINDFRQYIAAVALVIVGAILQLNTLDIVQINVWSVIWPVLIIAAGLSIIVNRTGKTAKNVRIQDLDGVSAIFAGNESINKSKDYKGGRATAVFGGVSIDLRDAVIKGEATLEVFALFGGIELKVPREWQVKHSVFPILGGVESKAQGDGEKAPTLYITGTVALGGVEVRT